MHNADPMKVFDSINDLMEKSTGFFFFDSLLIDDVRK